MKHSKRKAILLRLDERTLECVDDVRERLNMNHSTWLRKAVRAQLEHAQRVELPVLRDEAIRRALER